MRTPLVYQVQIRPWLHRLRRRSGHPVTLADLPSEALDAWARMGVTHAWLMGVWPTGAQARQHAVRLGQAGRLAAHAPGDPLEEICGSPYAVAGYAVDPVLGGDSALAKLRAELRKRGLGLILDFVPNHLALDHPWVRRHPDWFVGSADRREEAFHAGTGLDARWIAHGKDPFFPAWTDTAQLDWRLRAVHEAMREQWLSVADRCDGIRADMAMLILPGVFAAHWKGWPSAPGRHASGSFWTDAIAAVKQRHPQFLTLAEAYWDLEPELLQQGFDFAYDKRFYDHLLARQPSDLRAHLAGGVASTLWTRGARFLENHDEVRVASVASLAEHRSWAAMLLACPGLRLCHEGQWEGFRERADIRTLRRKEEPIDHALRDAYSLLARLGQKLGGWRSPPELLGPQPAWPGNPSHEAFVSWAGVRENGTDFVFAINLASHEAQCLLPVPAGGGGGVSAWVDLVHGQRFPVRAGAVPAGAGVLPLHLGPHQCVWLVPA